MWHRRWHRIVDEYLDSVDITPLRGRDGTLTFGKWEIVMRQNKGTPPREVTLVYQLIAGQHSFFSREVPGLAVGSSDLREAYTLAIVGLGHHVGVLWSQSVSYEAVVSFEQFATELESAPIELSQLGMPLRGRLHLDGVAA